MCNNVTDNHKLDLNCQIKQIRAFRKLKNLESLLLCYMHQKKCIQRLVPRGICTNRRNNNLPTKGQLILKYVSSHPSIDKPADEDTKAEFLSPNMSVFINRE